MSAHWANAVRAHMVRGKNPIERYLRYHRKGLLTSAESRDLTTEIIEQLQDRVVALEKRA